MSYRKATLRHFPPTTRQLAKRIDGIDCLVRSLKLHVNDVAANERDSIALRNHKCNPFPWLTIEPDICSTCEYLNDCPSDGTTSEYCPKRADTIFPDETQGGGDP